jgi:hypothetical protein
MAGLKLREREIILGGKLIQTKLFEFAKINWNASI